MFENDCRRCIRACKDCCDAGEEEGIDMCKTEARCEYGFGGADGGEEMGRGRRCAGMGECEFVYEDCARISSTASSSNSCVECASMSAFEGSTKNNEGCKDDRRR